MDSPVDRDTLRALVREILRELVSSGTGAPPRVEQVSISDDAALAAFVRRLLELFDDPATREDIRAGRHVFRLKEAPAVRPAAPSTSAPARAAPRRAASPEPAPMPERIDAGVLSEAKVIAIAASRDRVVLGKRVAVTPLARDKARELGLKLERER